MMLPKDPMILFSFVNTKLRDQYPSLDAFCEDMQVERKEIESVLADFDFKYDEKQNKFV